MSKPVSYDLADLTAPDIAEYLSERRTVLIPLGSHEQHGQHLPIGTDVITAMSLVHRVAELTGVVHTPPVWMGYSPQHLYAPGSGRGTVTLRASTYLAVISDLTRSLIHTGFDRLVFVNGHGGNNVVIDPVLRQVRADTGAMLVFVHGIVDGGVNVGLFDGILENAAEDMPGGHGSELETSQDLAWNPALVRLDRATRERARAASHLPASFAHPDGRSGIAFEGRNHFRAPWDYADITDVGMVGDPTTASAEKGAAALDALAAHIARGVTELESVDVAVHDRAFRNHAL